MEVQSNEIVNSQLNEVVAEPSVNSQSNEVVPEPSVNPQSNEVPEASVNPMSTSEISEAAVNSTSDAADQQQCHGDDAVVPDAIEHGCKESKPEVAEGEVRSILEAIASTGRFWLDWEKLKSMLSFQLKQVLSEYPDAEKTTEQQNASFGETYLELVNRLDEALLGFTEGPPFTLQRLCEILLDARSIYPKLSKLALALEKNLSVTSMLTISGDLSSRSVMQEVEEPEKPGEEPPKLHSDSVQNGVDSMVTDRDEVMVEVEQVDIDEDMAIAMEAYEDIVGSSETHPVQTTNATT